MTWNHMKNIFLGYSYFWNQIVMIALSPSDMKYTLQTISNNNKLTNLNKYSNIYLNYLL